MTWATDLLDKMKQRTHKAPPLVQTLKLGLLEDWGDGWVRKTWQHQAELLHQDGSMFGGYAAALFDQTFAFTAMTVLADDEYIRTTNLNVNFISLSRSEDIILEAKVVSRSRRLLTVEGKLMATNRTIRSTATAQQMILKRPMSQSTT